MQDKEFYIKNGLIYGTVNIIYLMITYVMGVDTMAGYLNGGLSLLISLGLMVYMGTQVRNAMGGFMTLGEGFKSLMVIYALGAFLYLLFNHVLGTVIDPELPGKLAQAALDQAMSAMGGLLDEDQLDEMYEQMSTEMFKTMEQNYTLLGFVKSYIFTILFGSIGALIGAAITKKENPNPFAEDTNTINE